MRWRQHAGDRAVGEAAQDAGHPEAAGRYWREELGASAVCLLAALTGWWLGERPGAIWAYGAAYLAGGGFAAAESWVRLRRGILDVHFLMLAVAAGAAGLGEWGEGAALLFLFSFSSGLEQFALERTQREIRALLHAAPKTAVVLDGGGRAVPVEELEPGMRLLVRPGELFPVDGLVLKGETSADESNLTGEAVPVGKREGASVYSGTLNLWGAVEVRVERRARESALQKVVRLIQTAQRMKAPSQRFTERFGTGYTWVILGLAVAMFFVWWLGLGHAPFRAVPGEPSAFYHAMTLLVVASPCALVQSIPSAVLAAIATGARRGVLYRGGAAVEKLGEVSVVAMDKTGTLTTGELRVEEICSEPAGHEVEVLRLACALEEKSTHPLARAVVRHGVESGVESVMADRLESVTGNGIRAEVGGREVRLGRRAWVLEGSGLEAGARDAVFGETGGGVSEVWLRSGELMGRIVLRDAIRPGALELVKRFRALGLRMLVLTGDRPAAAAHLKQALGLEDVRGELSPEQKLEVVRGLSAAGERVAMVGDGVNDAPSIAAAHVGVAMGARGSDAALEQADLVLMQDRLENFLLAYELSGAARRVIRQNLGVSLGVICLLMVLALGERLQLTVGVLGHEGSTILVVLNSLRLLWIGRGAGGGVRSVRAA